MNIAKEFPSLKAGIWYAVDVDMPAECPIMYIRFDAIEPHANRFTRILPNLDGALPQVNAAAGTWEPYQKHAIVYDDQNTYAYAGIICDRGRLATAEEASRLDEMRYPAA